LHGVVDGSAGRSSHTTQGNVLDCTAIRTRRMSFDMCKID
jgi:hypothetical protein